MEKQLPKENRKLQKLIDTYANGSQNAFSELIGVSQANINRLFRLDDRNNEYPNVVKSKSVLTAINKKYDFATLEWFKKVETEDYETESNVDDLKKLTVKEPFEQFVVFNKFGNEIANMPDGSFLMKAPLVPVKAYARYISEGDSAEYLENAEFVYFRVDHVAKGRYAAFVIKGDSFWNEGGYDTPDKAIALGRELQRTHWKDGFRDSELGWIIITHNNIVIKDIIKQDLVNGIITCHSRNLSPEYSDFILSLDEDVKSIWKVIKRQF